MVPPTADISRDFPCPSGAVLVLDDVSAIVEEFMIFLDLAGIRSFGAHSLDSAMAQLKAHPEISVVLADVRLPRESGLDLERLIRADDQLQHRPLHLLFMTGQTDLTGQEQPERLLSKPIDLPRLLDRLHLLLAVTPP